MGNVTPRLEENEIEIVEETTSKTSPVPKVQKTMLKLKMSRQQRLERPTKSPEPESNATQPMEAERASSSTTKKRDMTEVDPELAVDEEEPSAKQILIGMLNSMEEFGALGFFSSGNYDYQ